MSHSGRELDSPRYAGLLIRGVALLLDGLLICMVCFPIAVGGLLKHADRFKGKKVIAVVCGRNIDLEVFKRIIG